MEARMSFRDKKKFFEQEIADHASTEPKVKSERKFSYLQEHEVAQLRREEEKKTSHMSQDEIQQYVQDTVAGSLTDGTDYDSLITKSKPVKTVKAERRQHQRLSLERGSSAPGSPTRSGAKTEDGQQISSAEERAIQAQKRAAWRKARMKSLEQDALKAQAVIEKSQELSREKSGVSGVSIDIGESSEKVTNNNSRKSAEQDPTAEERTTVGVGGTGSTLTHTNGH